jgi:hypothetical protein
MTIEEAFTAIAGIQAQVDAFNPDIVDVEAERKKLEYKRILIESIQSDVSILLLQRQLNELTPQVS